MKQVPSWKEEETKTRKRIMTLAVLALIIGSALSVIPSVALASPTSSQYFEEWVPMRDGVRLHTFVYLPDPEVWGPGPYPAIVARTPYGIGDPEVLPGKEWPTGAITGWPEGTAHGYAVVFQDTRGRFASEGVDRIFYDDISDGYDTIEWVAAQPWCDGNVGIGGGSAGGITSYLAGGEKPPHLRAIATWASSANLYNDFVYEGGALELETPLVWIALNIPGLSLSHITQYVLPNLPPDKTLEDVYAEWLAILTSLTSHLGFVSPDRPVDSEWWMHLPLLNYPAISVLSPFWNELLSHPTQDEFRDHLNVRDTIEVPTLQVAGWYDLFVRGNLEAFMEIQERVGNQKIFIGYGSHFNIFLDPEYLPYDPRWPWFDYWLKGVDTGIMDEPPVLYNTLGVEGWRYADQWPPADIEYTVYYLHGDGTLSTDSPSVEEPPLSYVYDPRDPVPTIGGRNLVIPPGSFDQRPVEPPYRDDVLVYTSSVLEEDVEITGPVKVVFSASSNASDTDFTAKLIDAYPDGSTMLVFDGVIRARYRESMRESVLMEPGTVYEFTIDLGDVSQVFKAGHRIQVDISSSNFPRRDRNTNTGNPLYTDAEEDIVIANNTIYHDSEHPSYVVLPVRPPKPRVFEGSAKIDTKEVTYEGPAKLYTLEKAVYLNFDGKWMKWEIKKYVPTEDREFYVCEKGLKVVVWTKRKTGETFALAKGPKVFFFGKAA